MGNQTRFAAVLNFLELVQRFPAQLIQRDAVNPFDRHRTLRNSHLEQLYHSVIELGISGGPSLIKGAGKISRQDWPGGGRWNFHVSVTPHANRRTALIKF